MISEPVFGEGPNAQSLAVVRSPRARRMGLAIDARGRVRLTLPTRAPLAPAYAWAESKRSWIEAQLARVPRGTAIVPGMTISVGGVPVMLDWSPTHPRNPRRHDDLLLVGGPLEMMAARVLRWLMREAKDVLTQETHEFAAKAGVSIASVGIGDPMSRWGSCASSGVIRYSWRLILAPEFVRRATVAHEVAHRVHMDHSPRFHALVATLLEADPKPARLWLRTHAALLHGFGRAA